MVAEGEGNLEQIVEERDNESPRPFVVVAAAILPRNPLLSFPQRERPTRILEECKRASLPMSIKKLKSKRHKGWH